MNNDNSNNPPDDKKISSLYTQGSKETPAKHINENILNHARSQTDNVIHLSFKQVIETLTSSRSLAVAAVLVIGISIILQIQFKYPDTLLPPVTEKLSDSELLFENTYSDNLEDLQGMDSSALSSPMATPEKKQINSDITSFKKESAANTLRNNTAINKPKAMRQMSASKAAQRLEQKKREKRSLERQAKQVEKRKRLLTENRDLNSVLSPQAISVLSNATIEPNIKNCDTYNNQQCLFATGCTLVINNGTTSCQRTANHCENDFSQFNDTKDKCSNKDRCEYIESTCECNTNGLCECINDTPPACLLITPKENSNENKNN